MASEITGKTWETFLDQHKSLVSLLDDHASLLVEIRKLCEDNSTIRDLVHNRLNTTETLIATFKQSTESLQEVTKREEEMSQRGAKVPEAEIANVALRPTIKPKSPNLAKPAPDPSSFFTIDVNPTPVEKLYKDKPAKGRPAVAAKANENPKRKVEERRTRSDPATEDEPKRKKNKTNNEREVPPPPSVEDEVERGEQEKQNGEDEKQAAAEEAEEDDSFTASVAARTNAKEEKRRAKADKKRKRESDGQAEPAKSPKGKKRKEKHETKIESTTKAVHSAMPVPPEKPMPELKQNGKRALPEETPGEGEQDDRDQGKGESSGGKRKRAKRKQAKA